MLHPLCYLAEDAPPQCRTALLAREEQQPTAASAADESAGPRRAWGEAPEILPGTFADMEAVSENYDFELKPHEKYPGIDLIRAFKGHTMKEVTNTNAMTIIEHDFKGPLNIFQLKTVIHGAFNDNIQDILCFGLSRQK